MMMSLSMGGGGGSIGADLRDIDRGRMERRGMREREGRPRLAMVGCVMTCKLDQVRSGQVSQGHLIPVTQFSFISDICCANPSIMTR
jgi:hypothetical protein